MNALRNSKIPVTLSYRIQRWGPGVQGIRGPRLKTTEVQRRGKLTMLNNGELIHYGDDGIPRMLEDQRLVRSLNSGRTLGNLGWRITARSGER